MMLLLIRNGFGGPGHQRSSDLILMVSFTFTIRRHLIRLASAPFTSSPLANFGLVAECRPNFQFSQFSVILNIFETEQLLIGNWVETRQNSSKLGRDVFSVDQG